MRRHAKAPSAVSTNANRRRTSGLFGLACLCVLGLVAFIGSSASPVSAAESFPGQGFLPHDRAWEMVSSPSKAGGNVIIDSRRTRAAADGSALGFISLTAFGDAIGTGVATDYLAQRSGDPDPGDNGWAPTRSPPNRNRPISTCSRGDRVPLRR